MSQVIVVGGGAAGMMAAYSAAVTGHQVTLIEKNEKLGKKIYITGKGRCNVTNGAEKDVLLRNIVSNSKFLYSSLYQFDNQSMMNFLEEHGCKVKVERGERVFPVSDHASDVIKALQNALKEMYVDIRLQTEAEALLLDDSKKKVQGVRVSDGTRMSADAVILACGGLSYPTTGSTGDGYRFAGQVGHTMEDCKPALVPFEVKEDWCKRLQGLSLKNVELKLFDGKKKIYQEFGEMLFTHFGISGPLVLSASSFYAKHCFENEAVVVIDLKPALSEEKLDKRILRDFEENSHKEFKNAVSGLFPAKLIPVMVELSGIPENKKVYDITKEERSCFLKCIKELKLTVTGTRGFSEAIITQGGVSVKEVNPSTMESRLCGGLYMAGEMLDLDALTGGFNLQIAWSTGYLAGSSIPW